jgi:cytochrome c553
MLEEGEEVMIEEPQEPMLEENEEAMIAEPQEEAEVVVVEDMVLVETTSLDGKTIYKACASCHGVNAEKSALGKSKIIKGWSESQIATALYGYKDSTYGGAMKGIMKGQVSKLSDEDIEVVSEYISTL